MFTSDQVTIYFQRIIGRSSHPISAMLTAVLEREMFVFAEETTRMNFGPMITWEERRRFPSAVSSMPRSHFISFP